MVRIQGLLWAIRKGADKVEKLIDAINKLESQFSLQNKDMNYFHVNCNKREKEVNKILEDHEKRIRSVEN